MTEQPSSPTAETPGEPDQDRVPAQDRVPDQDRVPERKQAERGHVRTEGETGVDDALGGADDPR